MKMGNIVPRARLEPTSLPLLHVGSLMSPLYRRPPVYAAPCLRAQCGLLQYVSPVKAICAERGATDAVFGHTKYNNIIIIISTSDLILALYIKHHICGLIEEREETST